MSVLIKGMEMPKSRGQYALCMYVHSDGTATVKGSYCQFEGEPFVAIPVPPHGKLIEKHDVFKLIQAFPEVDKLLPVEFMEALYNLPTFIPAEEMPKEET